MNRNDKLRLQHVVEAAKTIEEYTQNITPEDFLAERMLRDAVTAQLMIIGEASNHLSDEFQEKHADIPFHKIVGMRNRIIHEYHHVDDKTVWKTCRQDIPELRCKIVKILGE